MGFIIGVCIGLLGLFKLSSLILEKEEAMCFEWKYYSTTCTNL